LTLFKRGNVYWAYVWVDGVRHAKSTGTGNRRQAEDIEHDFKQEVKLKQYQLPQLDPQMTFATLAARFLAEGAPKPYHVDRLKLLLPYFGDTPIGRITKNLARQYRQERHRQKKLTETTINRDLECLRHILFWAVDEGLLSINPLSRMRLERERRRRRPVLGLVEEGLLLASSAPHLRKIVICALDTGMRRGEILNQRWEGVDFARELLFVTRSKTPEGEAREIPLSRRLLSLFWEQREDEGLIFTFKDRPIHRIKTAWKAALRRAGIRPCRFHDLRHTFNTRLMEAGVMQEVRKALMGHSSGEDVNSIYTHVELPIKREAIRKLEAWVEFETQKRKEEANGRRDQASSNDPGAHDGKRDDGDTRGGQAVPRGG
jgi:integrase